jgi:signal transduction histidine kinase
MPLAVDGWPLRALVVIQDFSAERQMRLTRERQEQFRKIFVGILGHDLRTPLIAERIVSAHLGTISVESTASGTTPTVRLPAASRAAALIFSSPPQHEAGRMPHSAIGR